MLVTWTKGPGDGVVHLQMSDWVHRKNNPPVFDFEFELGRGVVHSMLCLRVMLGVAEKEIDSLATEGMAVVGVGSLDKKDWAVLEERKEKWNDDTESAHKAVRGVARVKAREG
jgi:hypothetical protein